MTQYLLTYFASEKLASAFLCLFGAASLGFATHLYTSQTLFRGMMYPLLLFGLIQLTVGSAVYIRTDKQVLQLREHMHNAPVDFRSAELARMQRVSEFLALYNAMEILVLAAGIGLTLLFRHQMLWFSIGVGMIIEAALLLVFDLFAEKRADIYIMRLQEFIPLLAQ